MRRASAAVRARAAARRSSAASRSARCVSVTRLEAGIADNVIPGEATATLNLRYPPDRTPAEAEAFLALARPGRRDARDRQQRRPRPGRRRLTGSCGRCRRPATLAIRAEAGVDERRRLHDARDLDAVNFGPGHTALAHHRDEHVAIASLVTAYEVLDSVRREPDRRRCRLMELAQRIDELWEAASSSRSRSRRRSRCSTPARCASPSRRADGWVVNEWVKKAILLYFRLRKVEPMEVGGLHFLDKIPVKSDYADRGVRVVPPGVARYGVVPVRGRRADAGLREHRRLGRAAHDGRHVGDRRLVRADRRRRPPRRAASASAACSSRRRRAPVIVEDGAFIGSRAVIVGGRAGRRGRRDRAQRRPLGVDPVIDVTGAEPVEHRGDVPPRAVVLPGTRPKEFPAGTYELAVRADRRLSAARRPI